MKISLHEKAVRLSEGGFAKIDGLVIKAVEVTTDDVPCNICDMDCLCRMEMCDLCAEVESYSHKRYRLQLVNP